MSTWNFYRGHDMKCMKRISVLLFAFSLSLFVPSVHAAEMIVDGGFESGDLSSWTQWGADSVTSPTAAGSYAARMTPGAFPAYALGMSGITSLLGQEIDPEDGMTHFDVSFSYQIVDDGTGGSTATSPDDGLFFGIVSKEYKVQYLGEIPCAMEIFTPLWTVELLGGTEVDGWRTYSGSFDLPGEIAGDLFAGYWVMDHTNGYGSTSLYLDEVSISASASSLPVVPVPEPGTILLLGAGVLGFACRNPKRIGKAVGRWLARLN